MKKLVCGLTLCLSVGNIFAGSTKDIYKKNWIDFNKNGVKDVYEDPAADTLRIAKGITDRIETCSCSEQGG